MELSCVPKAAKGCPTCGSEAVYRHGHTKAGKQRYRCLLCGRQFTPDSCRRQLVERPRCPQCGLEMHLYKVDEGAARFRCSRYPSCKTYLKLAKGEMA